MTADPPAGVVGGCGLNLHRLVLMLHFQGQMTCERIVTLLTAAGLSISKRQVVRLLTVRLDLFRAEEEAAFGAGPRIKSGGRASAYVSVDDTGARHAGKSGYTTQFGSDRFTTDSRRSAQDRANRASRCLTQSSGRNGALCGQRGGGRLHARGQPGARRHRCAKPSRSPRIRLRGRLAGAFARARPDRIAPHPRSRARRQRRRGSWGAITAEDRLAAPSFSPTTPDSSVSATTPCAGFTPSVSSTSSFPPTIGSAPPATPRLDPIGANISGPCIGRCVFVLEARAG